MKTLIAYIPVLHKGYVELLKKADQVLVLGRSMIEDIGIDYLIRKDFIRSLEPESVALAFRVWGFQTDVLEKKDLKNFLRFISVSDDEIIMPAEDVSFDFATKYLETRTINFESVFLRWHRDNVADEKQAKAHQVFSVDDFEKRIMNRVLSQSEKSWDWWRQTCAFFVKNGEVLLTAINEHLPDEQAPYAFGDPRAVFKRGIHVELSTSEHAEARVIAEAARNGITLEGGDIFCTDFPCPPCAKLVARSGIKRLFFKKGYAMLDSEEVLKNSGIQLICVN